MPTYVHNHLEDGLRRFPDFSKRVACLRELFEECNILVADDNGTNATLDAYRSECDGKFIKFCKQYQVNLNLGALYGLCRIASPMGYFPANDTQFYVHFCDERIDDALKLDKAEFTEARWLTVNEALSLYESG